MPDSDDVGKAQGAPRRNRCWWPECKRRSWIEDHCGWHWCFRHWLYQWRWAGCSRSWRWYQFRYYHLHLISAMRPHA